MQRGWFGHTRSYDIIVVDIEPGFQWLGAFKLHQTGGRCRQPDYISAPLNLKVSCPHNHSGTSRTSPLPMFAASSIMACDGNTELYHRSAKVRLKLSQAVLHTAACHWVSLGYGSAWPRQSSTVRRYQTRCDSQINSTRPLSKQVLATVSDANTLSLVQA